jgi:hypothetical protein
MRRFLEYAITGAFLAAGWVLLGDVIGEQDRDDLGWSLVGALIVWNVVGWVGGKAWQWHRTRIYHPIPVIPDEQACAVMALAETVRKMHPVDMDRYQEAYWEMSGCSAYNRAAGRVDRIAYESRRLDGFTDEYGELLALGGATTVAAAVACRDLVDSWDFGLVTGWWTDLGLPLPITEPSVLCWVCSSTRNRPATRVVVEYGSDGGRRGVCQTCGATSRWEYGDTLLMVGGPWDPAWRDLWGERLAELASVGRKWSAMATILDSEGIWGRPMMGKSHSTTLTVAEALRMGARVMVADPQAPLPKELPPAPPRTLAVGQWLGLGNRIIALRLVMGQRWVAYSSSGASYWQDVYPDGLRTSDEPASYEMRQRAVWPS